MTDPGADRRLELVWETMRAFADASVDPVALLGMIAGRVAETLGGLCLVALVSDDGAWLEPRAAHAVDPAVRARLDAITPTARLPLRGDHPIARALAAGQHLHVSPVPPDLLRARLATPGAADAMIELGVHSVLFVPLRARATSVGALTVARFGPDAARFDDAELRLARALADHAALAITNVRLVEAGRRELAERMATEAVLRRGFLEAAPDAVVIIDPAGQIVLVNSQAEALFGYERAEMVGQSIEIVVPARYRAGHGAMRAHYLAAPETRPMGVGRELFAVKKDGREFAAEISLSPIVTPDGTLVAAAVRDVTERRRELEERARRTQEASRLKSEFLANMSHELRTPLNAIIGFTSLMHAGKAGPIADVHREYLGDILASSRHLLQLINDVLDLAKVEAGRMEIRPEPLVFDRVLHEVRDIVRGIAADKRIRVDLVPDPAVPTVTVDPRMLKQVLYNYLSNAIKFTPDGGRVWLRIRGEGDARFRIEVEDTGIGIRPQDLERLFVEFQQLDHDPARRQPGTGLGLSLTRRIVEAQGGEVGVTSTPGKGTLFWAVLPRGNG